MKAILRHLPPSSGTSLPVPSVISLSDVTTFGSDDTVVDICLNTTRYKGVISSRHGTIRQLGNSYFLKDHASDSGIFVNDVKIGKDAVELKPNDRICFGFCFAVGCSPIPVGATCEQPTSEFCYRFAFAKETAASEPAKRIRTENIGNQPTGVSSASSYQYDEEPNRKMTQAETQRRLEAEKQERADLEAEVAKRLREEFADEERQKSAARQREYERDREREAKDREDREEVHRQAEKEAKRKLEDELTQQRAEYEQLRKQMEQEAQQRHTEIEMLRKEQEQLKQAAEESKKQRETTSALKNQLEEELTCCVCQDLMVVPVTLACAHSFCEECIVDWLCTKRECPTCRQQFNNEIVSSVALNNAVEKLLDQKENAKQDRIDREVRKKQWMAKRETELRKVIQKGLPPPPPRLTLGPATLMHMNQPFARILPAPRLPIVTQNLTPTHILSTPATTATTTTTPATTTSAPQTAAHLLHNQRQQQQAQAAQARLPAVPPIGSLLHTQAPSAKPQSLPSVPVAGAALTPQQMQLLALQQRLASLTPEQQAIFQQQFTALRQQQQQVARPSSGAIAHPKPQPETVPVTSTPSPNNSAALRAAVTTTPSVGPVAPARSLFAQPPPVSGTITPASLRVPVRTTPPVTRPVQSSRLFAPTPKTTNPSSFWASLAAESLHNTTKK